MCYPLYVKDNWLKRELLYYSIPIGLALVNVYYGFGFFWMAIQNGGWIPCNLGASYP